MLIRIAKKIQLLLGIIPVIWVLFFLGYVLLKDNILINYLAFVLFIAAFHSIWIWLLFTVIISILEKKVFYQKLPLILFILGIVSFILIVTIDPGGYWERLLD